MCGGLGVCVCVLFVCVGVWLDGGRIGVVLRKRSSKKILFFEDPLENENEAPALSGSSIFTFPEPPPKSPKESQGERD